jgi:hypothetical protein
MGNQPVCTVTTQDNDTLYAYLSHTAHRQLRIKRLALNGHIEKTNLWPTGRALACLDQPASDSGTIKHHPYPVDTDGSKTGQDALHPSASLR